MSFIRLFRENPQYLRAAVYGANDGLVTTFVVVAGSAGALLPASVVLILGGSNVLADGLSMALGDFLGEHSQRKLDRQSSVTPVWHTGLITFVFFLGAGLLPLLPYLAAMICQGCVAGEGAHFFLVSALITFLAMFSIGSARSLVTQDNWWKNGLEMLGVGLIAAAVAYLAGSGIERWLLS